MDKLTGGQANAGQADSMSYMRFYRGLILLLGVILVTACAAPPRRLVVFETFLNPG
jgi:hypothetical protein